MTKHYFDYAAATPMSQAVFTAMQPFFTEQFYNPSALYLDAQAVKQSLAVARSSVARVLSCKPSEVIFVAGGTESDNLAIHGVMQQFPGKKCVVSAIEHDAVLKPAAQYDHAVVPVAEDGRVDMSALAAAIDEETVLVSIMYTNNEIGTLQPLQEVASLLKTIRSKRAADDNDLPLYLHTDACQAGNYLPLLVHNLGVDLMTLNGGKIYGPKQSGILYVATGVMLQPQVLGGGQERTIRSGTENVAACVGFATALQEAADMREEETARVRQLRDYAIESIMKKIPTAVINGSHSQRLANNIHVTIPGVDNERLMMELDERGFMVATGSACSASSDEPSHVLRAIGLNDAAAQSSIRISLGRQTTEAGVDAFIDSLASLVASDVN